VPLPDDKIYIGPDHHVRYDDAADERTGTALTTGTCTFLLTDEDGATVTGSSGEAAHVSDGDYFGVIDGPTCTAALVEDAYYTCVITFSQGDYDDVRYLVLRAAKRGRN
jgi:hypothetical protein